MLPPPMVFSLSTVVALLRTMVSLAPVGSSVLSVSGVTVTPSTSGWLPRNTLTVPSSAASCEVCT